MCGSVTLAVAGAQANGGTSIANAPELPIGTVVTGAKKGVDFWRVTIRSGDTLRIDYEPVATPRVALCLLEPDVTDFTLRDTRCSDFKDTDESGGKRQTVHELALPGRWSLAIGYYGDGACVTFQKRVNVGCQLTTGYSLTAYVVHRTTTTLQAVPKLVKRGSTVKIPGQVQGADRGNVVLQERVGKRLVNKQLAKLTSAGRFAFTIRAAKAGTFSYIARFPGNANHKPSKRAFKITVV
jgi:hypothetical protein